MNPKNNKLKVLQNLKNKKKRNKLMKSKENYLSFLRKKILIHKIDEVIFNNDYHSFFLFLLFLFSFFRNFEWITHYHRSDIWYLIL